MKNLVKLKDHLYVPEDFSKSHYYYADPEGKKKYTGVTTVINVLAKPALIGWAARMACEYIDASRELINNIFKAQTDEAWADWDKLLGEAKVAHTRKKEEAGAHGTDAHALVEEWIKSVMPSADLMRGRPTDEKYAPIYPFIDWALETVDHFLFAERKMADPELFIAGTADFAFVAKNGKRFMADFKTSSGIYGIDFYLQVAAYRLLAESEGDEPYDGQCIVRLGKDGSFEAKYTDSYVVDRDAFLAALTLYRAQAYHK